MRAFRACVLARKTRDTFLPPNTAVQDVIIYFAYLYYVTKHGEGSDVSNTIE